MKQNNYFTAAVFLLLLFPQGLSAQKLPGLIPFRNAEGLFGFCDSTKKIIIPCRFDVAEPFDGDSAFVSWDNKQSHIFKDGRLGKTDSNVVAQPAPFQPYLWWFPVTIPVSYFVLTEPNPGPFPVKAASGLYAYVKGEKDTVIPARFSKADYFNEGLAFVKQGDSLRGFIDKKGKWVIRFGAESPVQEAYAFNKGFAECLNANGGHGLIDKGGNWIIPPLFDVPVAVYNSQCLLAGNTGSRYFCDGKGRPTTPVFYSSAGSLVEGRIVVQDPTEQYYGMVDDRGKPVLPCRYDNLGNLSRGAAPAGRNGHWGLIDRNGKQVLPFEYDIIEPAGTGIFIAGLNNRYGYFNASGRPIIPMIYQECGSFDGRGMACVADSTGLHGMIDLKGKTLIPFLYDEAFSFNNDSLAIVARDGRYGLINRKGDVVVKIEYSELHEFDSFGLAWAQDWEGNYGCIDSRGNIRIKFKYNILYNFDSNGLVKVQTGDGEYYIDWKGNEYMELAGD